MCPQVGENCAKDTAEEEITSTNKPVLARAPSSFTNERRDREEADGRNERGAQWGWSSRLNFPGHVMREQGLEDEVVSWKMEG